ncbi:Type 1 glutamine amidotransferase-like domain-containing protein [Amnibacterium setariae]|nr:Type 1 glutamine amidotransferase-like domain-containing protein [Amnibacterium setariae]
MLLTSGGITPGPILDALVALTGKPVAESRVAVVIDAILPFPGDSSMLLRHLQQLHSLGWAELDVVSLFGGPRALLESRLRGADVVFGYGGSNHWLAHAWRATGLVPVLEEVLERGVYVGMSAGSMIFSTRHADAVDAFDDHEEVAMLELGDDVAAAVPLLDWTVLCHLGAPFLPEDATAWAAAGAAALGAPVWFLDDASALLVRDPGAEPEVVGDGHWLRYDERGTVVDSR